MSVIGKMGGGLVKLYQSYISADYNGERHAHCLYTPSCSHYMTEAIEQEGAMAGTVDGLVRIARCTPSVLAVNLQRFAAETAGCPEAQLDERFTYQTAADREKVHQLKHFISEAQARLVSGDAEQAAPFQQRIVDMLRDRIRIQVVDHPGQKTDGPPQFVIYSPSADDHHEPTPSGRPVRTAIANGVGALGAIGGAVAGGLIGGVSYALLAGLLFAPAAALGKTDRVNQSIARRYGPDSILGLAGLERLAGMTAYQTHAWVTTHTHSETLACAAGLFAGLPAGIAAGLWSGCKELGSEGAHAGRILAHNLTDDLMGHLVRCPHGAVEASSPSDVSLRLSVATEASAPTDVSSSSSKSTWTIIGSLDGRSQDLEAAATGEAIDFQNHPHEGVNVVLELSRHARSRSLQTAIGWAQRVLAPMAAIGAAGAVVTAGLPPLWTACLALDALSFGVTSYLRGGKRLQKVQKEAMFHNEPVWNGVRRFDVSAAPEVPIVARSAGPPQVLPASSRTIRVPELPQPTSGDKAARLADLIHQGRALHPSEHTLLLLSGHGNGYRKLGQMKAADVEEALRQAFEESGQKLDLVVVEACKGANLEMLKSWGRYARYAVVSEDVMWDAGFPWQKVLNETLPTVDARGLGEALVHWSGGVELDGDPKVPTASLVDLEQVPSLATAVENLAARLLAGVEAGRGQEARAAMWSALHFPRAETPTHSGLVGAVERFYIWAKRQINFPDLADLGGICANLRNSPDAEIRQAVDEVNRSLQAAVISNQVHPSYADKAAGLSVRVVSPVFFERDYANKTGMHEWGHLINQLRPWRARAGSYLLETLWHGLTSSRYPSATTRTLLTS